MPSGTPSCTCQALGNSCHNQLPGLSCLSPCLGNWTTCIDQGSQPYRHVVNGIAGKFNHKKADSCFLSPVFWSFGSKLFLSLPGTTGTFINNTNTRSSESFPKLIPKKPKFQPSTSSYDIVLSIFTVSVEHHFRHCKNYFLTRKKGSCRHISQIFLKWKIK